MDTEPLTKWLNKELSILLECDVGEEYSKNILKIESENEIKEFIGSLLDLSIPKNKSFLSELLIKLKKPSEFNDVKVYVKPKIVEETSNKFNKQKISQQNKNEDSQLTSSQTPKKSSFSLYPTDNRKNPVRHSCECQATKHKLIGNCLKCGRIVCEEEMSGPCFFCGNLVCTKEEREKINRGSNKGEQLKAELLSRTWKGFDAISQSLNALQLEENIDEETLKKAIAHKDKLIDFDRTSAKRTQVIDDESDYFNTNSKWLSEQQRVLLEQKQEEIREKRFGSRQNKTFTLDFAGRRVIDEKKEINLHSYAKDIENILNEKPSVIQHSNEVINPCVNIVPKFIEEKKKKNQSKIEEDKNISKKPNFLRLQDQELQEMKDDGMCLSMHQPWAQLLVTGIKRHEGRTWYTPYRGRLWIHAASKQPIESDIKEVEAFYKNYYSDQFIQFPASYPTSCLIGYVDLVDCLSADTYKETYPNGESESDYVFICDNFRELVIKIPMPGQHKLFKLEKSIHSTAKKTSVIYHDN